MGTQPLVIRDSASIRGVGHQVGLGMRVHSPPLILEYEIARHSFVSIPVTEQL
jgi:hypothetical protein